MSGMCPECFRTGSKSSCLLPRCPYRQRQQLDALDQLTAESQPDPLEEMASYPARRFVAQAHIEGNEVRAAAVELTTYDESLYYFLQGTGRR